MTTRSAIPDDMKAIAIDRFGPPDVLVMHTLPIPDCKPAQVLIRVKTAGVGSWDARIRAGSWAERDTFPQIPGTEGSGIVVAVGSRVTRLKVGDEVMAMAYPAGGFYAEYVAVNASNVALKPEGLDDVEAGAVPIIGLTALQGVDDALGIEEGESVIVHGASGNVGMIAVQFAKLRGARVLGTASGKDGLKLVKKLGADAAVDGKEEDIVEAARRFAPGGVDAVLAFVGGKELTACLDTLRRAGRLAIRMASSPNRASARA
jgi:NADPH2:quinone reductase